MKKLTSLFLSYFFTVSVCFGFFNQNTVWETRATAIANNKGGGCFVFGASGTDYSQQDDPQYIVGGITTAGAGNVFLSTSASADWVGNCFYIVGGYNMMAETRGQITAVTPGVDFTAVTTGAVSLQLATGAVVDGRIHIGGAISLNYANDRNGSDKIFESMVSSNTMWIKNNGTISTGEAVSVTSNQCSYSTPCYVIGYNTTRGDDPSPFGASTSAPSINVANFGMAYNQNGVPNFNFKNLFIFGTAATVFNASQYNYIQNMKIWNLTSTANRTAYQAALHSSVRNSEFVALYGFGMNFNAIGGSDVNNVYVHDSPYGIYGIGGSNNTIKNALLANCAQTAINNTSNAGTTTSFTAHNITIDGFNNVSRSTAIWLNSSTAALALDNSIIANCYAGIINVGFSPKSQNINFNNAYWNLITTATPGYNLNLQYSTFGVNPQFEDNTELYGSTAATASGVLMMHGGGMFSDAGITDNHDFVTLHSGNGITSNVSYLIIGHSSFSITVTPNIAANATQDKTWTIRKGKRWNIGTNLKAQGTTWRFGGSTTTTYVEPGAIQRQETTTQVGGSTGFFIQ